MKLSPVFKFPYDCSNTLSYDITCRKNRNTFPWIIVFPLLGYPLQLEADSSIVSHNSLLHTSYSWNFILLGRQMFEHINDIMRQFSVGLRKVESTRDLIKEEVSCYDGLCQLKLVVSRNWFCPRSSPLLTSVIRCQTNLCFCVFMFSRWVCTLAEVVSLFNLLSCWQGQRSMPDMGLPSLHWETSTWMATMVSVRACVCVSR